MNDATVTGREAVVIPEAASTTAAPVARIEEAATADRTRLYFLDNLRAVAIVLVIVLHASISYMAYAPTWWYVLDPHHSVLFTMLVLVIDVPIMPALFFVAGYFALPSLGRRGPGSFVREKLVRVAAPWVIGVALLAPIETYMTEVSRHISVGYLQFWTHDFWGPLYQQSVYWYLGVLLAEFLVLACVWVASPRLRASTARVEQPQTRLFVAFVAVAAAGSAFVAPAWSIDDWQPMALFVVQPARIAFYAGYFVLGIYAERRGWFRAGGFRPELGPWGWGAVITGFFYLGLRMGGLPDTVPVRAFESALFSLFCLEAVIGGVALFQLVLDRAGPAWRTVAGNSYGIYYVHPLILYPLAYVLVGVGAPSIAKALVLVTVTFAASLALSALVLKRLPGLRRMF
ncbi:MAG: acyltransferase family protein [Candidatus Limnocylindrales bacterium]